MRKSKWMYAAAGVALVTMLTSAWAGDRVTRLDKDVATFRLASSSAITGFTAQKTPDGQTIYVGADNVFTLGQVEALTSSRSRDREMVALTLVPGVSEQLALSSGRTGATQVALVRGGRVVTVGSIESIGVNETTLSGLNANEVTRLARILASKGLSGEAPSVTVVPRRETAAAGGTVTVDVYVSNVTGLRTYQFALQTSGGTTGSLSRTQGVVDVSHADFVFGTDQVIQAVDEEHGRFGAVLFRGSRDVTGQKYVGSYTFAVSPDASGSFTIGVDETRVSFMTDAAGQDIVFRAVPTTVQVQ